MVIILLVVVLLTPDITSVGQGSSHCMADCNMGQCGLSLYEQYCCQIGNYGKTLCWLVIRGVAVLYFSSYILYCSYHCFKITCLY